MCLDKLFVMSKTAVDLCDGYDKCISVDLLQIQRSFTCLYRCRSDHKYKFENKNLELYVSYVL